MVNGIIGVGLCCGGWCFVFVLYQECLFSFVSPFGKLVSGERFCLERLKLEDTLFLSFLPLLLHELHEKANSKKRAQAGRKE